jgi:hypothetical protein
MRDFEHASESCHALDVAVGGLGRVLSGERKRAGIERGVVEDKSQAAVVEAGYAAAVVAEGGVLSERGTASVELAAVDEESICRSLR